MSLAPGVHTVGAADGDLLVLTYREGVAQKVGHDLILEAASWRATVDVGGDGLPASVVLEVDPRSLHVRSGLHGAKPLTDSDRASIRDNIARKVLGSHPISFRSTGVDAGAERITVTGELEIAQRRRAVSLTVTLDATGRARGTLPLRQTDWGITPYRALMGALKVRDEVVVTIDVALPTAT